MTTLHQTSGISTSILTTLSGEKLKKKKILYYLTYTRNYIL